MKKNKYIVEEVFNSKDTENKKKIIKEILSNIIKKTETNKMHNI